MKAVFILTLVGCVCAKAPLYNTDDDTAIADEYIVVLRNNITDDGRAAHMDKVKHIFKTSDLAKSRVKHEFLIGDLVGYTITAPRGIVERLRESPDVDYIEANQVVKGHSGHESTENTLELNETEEKCHVQRMAGWNLVRTNQRMLNIDGRFSYKASSDGTGVTVYVMDSGINTQHTEFEGRASWGVDFVDDPSPFTDRNGHGTHVAGIIGGKTFGVAKKVKLVAVRTMNQNSSGKTDNLILAIEWITKDVKKHKEKKPTYKAITNMSLGTSRSAALNAAIAAAANESMIFVVSAGNDQTDACSASPASAEAAITVAATNAVDKFSTTFSNYGTCVDILAPGEDIQSAWINSNYSVMSMTGTSQAAPHVAGVIARYLSYFRDSTGIISPETVRNWVVGLSSKDMVQEIPDEDTPNNLLFLDCY
ncbi:PREDICTED: proteinase T-like [Branchiostoma belcheri]|uniref:Proteinase T-like n=1 Tax=Branchiostoma belcheri TaxID=7741 RepID=A0A6P4YDE6_BRABE|nr:PREDICTED: proteinase T-like [Branchiostoma belcheri]